MKFRQALEGLGESQEVKSQGIDLSRPDLDAADTTEFNDGGEELTRSDSGSITDDLLSDTRLSSQDKDWISPPYSVYSSSSESGATSCGASFADSFNNTAVGVVQNLHGLDLGKDNEQPNSVPTSENDFQGISEYGASILNHMEMNKGNTISVKLVTNEPDLQADGGPSSEARTVSPRGSQPLNKESEAKSAVKDELSSFSKVKNEEGTSEDHIPNATSVNRAARGKYKSSLYFN